MVLHWPSYLAGWMAAQEGHLGTGQPASPQALARDEHNARQEFERELCPRCDKSMNDGDHIFAERWGLRIIGCPEYKGTFSIASI